MPMPILLNTAMLPTRRWLLSGLLMALTMTAMAAGVEPYLTPDGRLRAELELRESQSGFAGVTGTVWTVEPGGCWSRAAFLNDRVRPPEQRGRLSGKLLAELAGLLRDHGFAALPTQTGVPPPVNPHTRSIRFGDSVRKLVLPPPSVKEGTVGETALRFQSLFDALLDLLPRPD